MPRQFCYVLVSDEQDLYAEMALISISLLRMVYPDAQVTVVVDGVTAQSLAKRRSNIARLADLVVYGDTRQQTPLHRSRFLKTSVRSLVPGDLLFLDVDTLPIRPFDELFEPAGAMAAALDRNRDNPEPHCPQWIEPHYRRLRWRYPVAHYYNTGVIYLPDTAAVRALGCDWHERWLRMSRGGLHNDQPAFNSAIDALGVTMRVLPERFNAMISARPDLAKDASIIHLFASDGRTHCHTGTYDLLTSLLAERIVDWEGAREGLRHTVWNASAGGVTRCLTALTLLSRRWWLKWRYARRFQS